MRKLCLGLAALTLAASTASVAAASVATIDVDNLLTGPGRASSGFGALSAEIIPGTIQTHRAYQTWTVETTGALAQLDLYGVASSAYSDDGLSYMGADPLPFDVTLTILGGGTAFSLGTVELGSVTISAQDVAVMGVTSFDFSALGIYATAGSALTWRMSVEACPRVYCVQGWSNWNRFDDGADTYGYDGGGAWVEQNGVLYGSIQQDMNFRTWMAVPEPTSWALMILGFGAAGVALRRRPVAA